MIFKCGCCGNETNDDDATYVYQGMGSSQYVCPACQQLPFIVVWARLDRDDSPTYIGDRLYNDVLGSQPKGEGECEHHVMTFEEIDKAFFVCSECGQLAQRGRLGMRGDEFMCTNCGHIHSSKEGE